LDWRNGSVGSIGRERGFWVFCPIQPNAGWLVDIWIDDVPFRNAVPAATNRASMPTAKTYFAAGKTITCSA
jgi:hypothetical protein